MKVFDSDYFNLILFSRAKKEHNIDTKDKGVNSSIIKPTRCPKYLVFFQF